MPEFIVPDWPVPAGVRALQSTRLGGVSTAPYADFNLGGHVGDAPEAVAENRALLRAALPADPFWLVQVHGFRVMDLDAMPAHGEADAALSRRPDCVCAVMTADCLPVLFCDQGATVVAAAHAGWRGLCAGVLEATLAAMRVPAGEILAWLGPAIGREAFEVGGEVRAAFVARDRAAASAFRERGNGKFLADLYALAQQRLNAAGVMAIHGGGFCTVSEARRFFSYRREGRTGRMASLIWLDGGSGTAIGKSEVSKNEQVPGPVEGPEKF
ncbi:MAG: peptidoglycan editing factor PgeF [Zoogloeaceae bacterium]|nr:peptidoglycan editing factor PgeF [Zoogloeaceae bacterium]